MNIDGFGVKTVVISARWKTFITVFQILLTTKNRTLLLLTSGAHLKKHVTIDNNDYLLALPSITGNLLICRTLWFRCSSWQRSWRINFGSNSTISDLSSRFCLLNIVFFFSCISPSTTIFISNRSQLTCIHRLSRMSSTCNELLDNLYCRLRSTSFSSEDFPRLVNHKHATSSGTFPL